MNEFVGVDEENMYLTKSRASLDDDIISQSDYDFDKVCEEDDGLVGKDPLPPLIVAYDK
jgi:hypothetical protein